MKDHELEWLCSHLGHTAEIHKLHYRSTSGFIERVNIGKLMVLQDLNIAGNFKGQRLQDIDIEDISEIVNGQGKQEEQHEQGAACSFATSGNEDFWDNEEDDEPPVAKQRKCNFTRQAWSKEEEQEILELFRINFSTQKNPGMKECNAAIKNSRKRNGLIHKRKWETIKKKVLRMIKKDRD